MNEPTKHLEDCETPVVRCIQDLMEVYRMIELPPKTRIKIIMVVALSQSNKVGAQIAIRLADQFIALLKDKDKSLVVD